MQESKEKFEKAGKYDKKLQILTVRFSISDTQRKCLILSNI